MYTCIKADLGQAPRGRQGALPQELLEGLAGGRRPQGLARQTAAEEAAHVLEGRARRGARRRGGLQRRGAGDGGRAVHRGGGAVEGGGHDHEREREEQRQPQSPGQGELQGEQGEQSTVLGREPVPRVLEVRLLPPGAQHGAAGQVGGPVVRQGGEVHQEVHLRPAPHHVHAAQDVAGLHGVYGEGAHVAARLDRQPGPRPGAPER